jgi:excinuclease ABC subunit C
MLDVEGEVIYVGKARSLKARVTNYTRLAGHTNRIARMISATASMEFVTVRTEAEALLLEANLIKRFRPRFNVLMRDDKSFPYILIARDHASPQILKHRGARARKGDYFGPFASAGAVNRTINMLQRAFLLRSCSDSVFESRTRPCLLHQIKRCAGPCTGEIVPADYAALVDEATRFLRGESQTVRQMYQGLMEAAAEALEFERAAIYRNRLWALAHVTADQSINPDGIEEADVFAAAQEGGQTCIQVFFFRTGQNWGNRAYFPRADRSLEVGEVLDSFIAQFYDDKPVPRLILLSVDIPSRDLLAEALSTKADRRIEIRVPQRGAKSGLVDHAHQNAREALARRLAEGSSQRRLLEGVADRFGLARVPRRIEVFDNSHTMGASAVGAMIVAGPEGFVKGQYRKFNIKSEGLTPGDDYAMMREVLTRRFKRIAEAARGDALPDQALPARREMELGQGAIAGSAETAFAHDGSDVTDDASDGEDLDFPATPDLVLIDGGAGQLEVARTVANEVGLPGLSLIGVAKGPDRDAGREHFHIPGRERPLMLEARDPVLYFIQRLRDEAHRFAIGTHRAKRSKALTANPLDEIEGIGPTRKRALLAHFGSAKAVSRAGVDDLTAVKGVSAELAKKIYDFFHERG